MAYTSKSLISNYLQRDLTEDEEGFLMVLIPAIKKWIDRQLNSTFDQATATTRYFDGGESVVDIDPATTITAVGSVQNDGSVADTYTSGNDYTTQPTNETVKTSILRRSGIWPYGSGRISVTAVFSEYDGGVPEDIQTIATRLAGSILKGTSDDAGNAGVKREVIEGHDITYSSSADTISSMADKDPIVKGVLDSRKQLYL